MTKFTVFIFGQDLNICKVIKDGFIHMQGTKVDDVYYINGGLVKDNKTAFESNDNGSRPSVAKPAMSKD